MERSPLRMCIAALAAIALAAGVTACGDDEPREEVSVPEVGVSIETTTSPTAEDETKSTDTTVPPDTGKPKIKGESENIPGVGQVPKPSKSQRQQIAKCVEQAEGDPQKLAECGQIAVR